MEIGGFFEKTDIVKKGKDNKDFFTIGEDNIFLLSGRTAIDLVIQDIQKEKYIKTVYFPSYSCNSMRDSFIKRGIEIKYYDVYFNGHSLEYKIDINEKCDIFFAMNYFGYSITNMEEYIKKFKDKDVCVIEDITHSLLSEKKKSEYSDYYIASLRKWFPINSGGIAIKRNAKFNIDVSKLISNTEAINLKKQAMKLKKEYNSLKTNDRNKTYKENLKKIFSDAYKASNNCIEQNYINKKMDEESINIIMNIDIDQIKEKINLNVRTIYENLTKYNFLIDTYNYGDCLLYVPIYIEKDKLKEIKKIIYKEGYYCPSHWPILSEINNLFENELSLVCDYRYSPEEIKEKIMLINEF